MIQKTTLKIEDSSITMQLPIVKVDNERRIVSGFATLDNIDSQGDIVTQEASMKAFKNFRGNIREMHQPIAAGKVVEYRPDVYVDKATGQVYNGVFVSAYISKGAQATWEKVLDGTLSGFSIGGSIVKSNHIYKEEDDRTYRKVDEYELVELSLVDNPANKFANVLFIQKSGEKNENDNKNTVNWCDEDGILSTGPSLETECPICNKSMKQIGSIDEEPTTEMLKEILTKFKEGSGEAKTLAIETSTVDVAKATDNPKEETVAEEKVETADVAKSAEQVELAKTVQETAAAVQQLTETVAGMATVVDAVKSLAEIVDGLKKTIDGAASTITEVKEEVNKFDSRVAAVEADTAVKKSGDVGGVTEKPQPKVTEKSLWGGAFIPQKNYR